ncbi:hypothetical protein LEP1GSC120_3784 [Leptospira santarosai str. 200702252]|uniref:Uncharacterized protein n=1 Tax=Leptospira santarosai str. MOR084 TaxID=1049984 RepID=A0A0E2BHX8_9LEPT|nr:hypothetical protein LEP1GSC179_1614 [Leptospira santarosai str. MOR084]EMM85274.1 hypothetical protein LEP1GSC039_0373 [Leptospira santarosai str. 2000027870]EMO96820.1 hypothetical protein LEP1GSC120_3784 [Leptospira santarosai str. 200702252]
MVGIRKVKHTLRPSLFFSYIREKHSLEFGYSILILRVFVEGSRIFQRKQ